MTAKALIERARTWLADLGYVGDDESLQRHAEEMCALFGQHTAGSSKGRTADFDSVNAGSSPAPASTLIQKLEILRPKNAFVSDEVSEELLLDEALAIIRQHFAAPDLVERVAEGLWEAVSLRASGKPRRISWEDAGQPTYDEFVPLAKAAIAAIGEVQAPKETCASSEASGAGSTPASPSKVARRDRNRTALSLATLDARDLHHCQTLSTSGGHAQKSSEFEHDDEVKRMAKVLSNAMIWNGTVMCSSPEDLARAAIAAIRKDAGNDAKAPSTNIPHQTNTLNGLLEHPWPEKNDFGRGYDHAIDLVKDVLQQQREIPSSTLNQRTLALKTFLEPLLLDHGISLRDDMWQAAAEECVSASEITSGALNVVTERQAMIERVAKRLFVTKLPDIVWPRVCSWDETKYREQFRQAAEAVIAEMEKDNV